MNKIAPYPIYKDSGVEWLGEVPKHWEVRRLKYWLKINKTVLSERTDPNYEFDYLDIGTVGTGRLITNTERIRFAVAPSRARRIVQAGDTIISTVRTYLKAVWHAEKPVHNLIASTGFAVLTPNCEAVPKFINYMVQSDVFTNRVTSESVGIAYPAITETNLGTFRVSIPPLPEQGAIVRYLDYVDRRVRRLTRVKRKLVALLTEQKQAIIHRAVTRGLDPDVPMKDSGVEWLGEVPEHWEVRRLKHLCSKSAVYGANVAATQYSETGVRFLRTTDITESGILKEEGVFLPADLINDYLLKDGDLLISRSGTVGRSFLYDSKLHGSCSYAGYLVKFVTASSLIPKYAFMFTKTQAFAGFLKGMAISSTIENVNGEKYANAPLPLPPLPEQAAIVEYLDQATTDIDTTIARVNREIELLDEYRTRLIADVVTGKLDVREVAAALPDVDPLADEDGFNADPEVGLGPGEPDTDPKAA